MRRQARSILMKIIGLYGTPNINYLLGQGLKGNTRENILNELKVHFPSLIVERKSFSMQ